MDLKPHQVSVVHKVVSAYPHRFLLCDEVGLGKTIEAGMVLKELRSRGAAERVLAIVPPNLAHQWQFEMKTKFNEAFSLLNTDTVRFLQDSQGFDRNPFTFSDSVLCSSSWVVNDPWANQCSTVDWDLVIVDEAHHARSRRNGARIVRTRLYDLVQKLAPVEHLTRGLLFLTATPMQLDTHELYSLVELLDPALFPSEDDFDRHRKRAPGLSQLVERLSVEGFPLTNEPAEDTAERVADWVGLSPDEALRRLGDPQGRKTLTDDLSDRHLLSKVLIRNRKAVIGGFMPRIATRWEVTMTPEERAAMIAVKNYVQYGYQLSEHANNTAVGFVMVIFQKLMASSIAAIRLALKKRRDKIGTGAQRSLRSLADFQTRLENDDNAADVIGECLGDEAEGEMLLLDHAIEALGNVGRDSKADVLVKQLETLFREQADAKIIVFTEFRETQRFLERVLVDQGWGVNMFHGQLDAGMKDRAVASFRDGSGPQVLISTEAGGEGRNFQFCHLLVNYDLPWNPMRVEQRIGRVDRIGQSHVVSIFNFAVKETIEDRVLDVLEHRIRIFQETVGGLDPILGETERDISQIMRLSEEQMEAALNDFGARVEERINRARKARRQLDDFIMDTKSYRREIVERIAKKPRPIDDDDLERFIGQLLASVKTDIRPSGGSYDLTFRGDFFDSHRKGILKYERKWRGVFRRERRPDEASIEMMVFGHPVIDAIVERVLDENYEGTTGTRRIPASDGLRPVKGWLFSYLFVVSGLQSSEHVVPVFVSDEGSVDRDKGLRILQSACLFDGREEEVAAGRIPRNLEELEPLARRFANTIQRDLQRDAASEAAGRVDQEIARLQDWFDYRDRVALDRLEATRDTLNRLRSSGDQSVRRIIPVWEANLRRDEALPERLMKERGARIKEIEKHRHPQVAWALKSLGRIEVVDMAESDTGRDNGDVEDRGGRGCFQRTKAIAGVIAGSPLDVVATPVPANAMIMQALLAERREEWEEGRR